MMIRSTLRMRPVLQANSRTEANVSAIPISMAEVYAIDFVVTAMYPGAEFGDVKELGLC